MRQFNFAWAKEDENFDPIIHNRMDLDVFKFSINHEEGGFAEARVWLKILESSRIAFIERCKDSKIFISSINKDKIELLFCGRFILSPHRIEGELAEYILTSRPDIAEDLLRDLHQTLSFNFKRYNPLFIKNNEDEDLSSSLEGTTKIHHWCPKTHIVNLSDIFKGNTHHFLKENKIIGSIQTRLTHVPIQRLDVTVKARWLQEQRGRLSLTARLRQFGHLGCIKSLTGNDLNRRWWREGQKLHRANYWVEESSLDEVSYAFNQKVHSNRLTSPVSLAAFDPLNQHREKTEIRLKVKSFMPKLVLGWKMSHLRDESLKFTLKQSLQETNVYPYESRSMFFNLHRLNRYDCVKPWHPRKSYDPGACVLHDGMIYKCNFPHRASSSFRYYKELFDPIAVAPEVPFSKMSSFFHSNHGYEAFDEAVRRAASYLLASARAFEVSFKTTLDIISIISCDSSLSLQSSSLPGGKVTGKVKQYTIVVDGESGNSFVSVILGVSIASKTLNIGSSSNFQDSYVFDSYCAGVNGEAPFVFNERLTAYGLSHVSWDDQRPLDHFGNNTERDAAGLLEDIIIKNQADEQEDFIHNSCVNDQYSLMEALKECRTSIDLKLHALKPFSHQSHVIKVIICDELTAPHQIDL